MLTLVVFHSFMNFRDVILDIYHHLATLWLRTPGFDLPEVLPLVSILDMLHQVPHPPGAEGTLLHPLHLFPILEADLLFRSDGSDIVNNTLSRVLT